ncbi:unnamed protein product [Closterium sp. Naga37s-1]|nr:unnamed protein product [Closterium sp. Naga37s-1]
MAGNTAALFALREEFKLPALVAFAAHLVYMRVLALAMPHLSASCSDPPYFPPILRVSLRRSAFLSDAPWSAHHEPHLSFFLPPPSSSASPPLPLPLLSPLSPPPVSPLFPLPTPPPPPPTFLLPQTLIGIRAARLKHRIFAPAMSGNPDFDRVIRVQANFVEQYVRD